MKRTCITLLILICLLPLTLTAASAPIASPTPPPKDGPPGGDGTGAEAAVAAAVQQALDAGRGTLLVTALTRTEVENVTLSGDAVWASAWLVPYDPQDGSTIPAEPGLVVAQKVGDEWQALLPGDPGWEPAVRAAPDDLLPAAEKQHWLELYAASRAAAEAGPFGGYRLPWAAGTRIVLTRSITHYSPPDPARDMHYAFDFATWHDSTGTSPMFAVYAAKAGVVKYARWTQVNGSETSPGNYLVLEDATTSPTTYQLYLHLAQDSIPTGLRVPGTPVLQGQYLGLADDTGASTANHLHFQVHTNPSSYWGKSVDITFLDVAVNGGRPRMLSEARNYPQYGSQGQTDYVSSNVVRISATPPQGDLLAPLNGATVASPTVHLEGWAVDGDSGLASAQFIARWGDAWQEIGSPFTTAQFSLDWDLCGGEVPDGPVSLALKLRDNAGSLTVDLPGLRHFTKNYTCPPQPPVCVPSASQVALFASPDYAGACTVLELGSYSSAAALGALGGDNAASIQVGAGVQARLYTLDAQAGRVETFTTNDSNLAENAIGADTVSSVVVQARSPALAADEAAAAAGDPAAPQAAIAVPYLDDMEGGQPAWTPAGLWRTTTGLNHTPGKTSSWSYSQVDGDYDTGAANTGSLTSPAVHLPASGVYYLRFWYQYDTESSTPHWDQRKVWVSANGGPFTELLQLAFDPQDAWLQSPALSLEAYAGQDVQVRFTFDTRDARLNGYKGWAIDDVSITDNPPPACSEPGGLGKGTAQARGIAYNTSLYAEICPNGDVDYYKFNGAAGDQVGAAVVAQAAGSLLDSYLFLLDADGTSVLASGDDLVPNERTDSRLSYRLPRTGTYYLKVRAWDHPSGGGPDYGYTLRLFQEAGDPSAQFTTPLDGSYLSGQPISLAVSASDAGSGVGHIEFSWHSGDWQTGGWTSLGTDWDGQDGWSVTLDPSDLPPQFGVAVYARVYDLAGNWTGTGAWNLKLGKSFSYLPMIAR